METRIVRDALGDYLEADMTKPEDEQFPPVPFPPQPDTLVALEYGVQHQHADETTTTTAWLGSYSQQNGWQDGEDEAHDTARGCDRCQVIVRTWTVGPGRPIEIIPNPDNPMNAFTQFDALGGGL